MTPLNPSIESNSGGAALTYAAGKGYEANVRLLPTKGANTGIIFYTDCTPSAAAVIKGNEVMARLLLTNNERKAKHDTVVVVGDTAMVVAITVGHDPIVYPLIDFIRS